MGWKERREEMERDLTKGINILSFGGAMSTKKNSLGLGGRQPVIPSWAICQLLIIAAFIGN